jgi:hypothetical protein
MIKILGALDVFGVIVLLSLFFKIEVSIIFLIAIAALLCLKGFIFIFDVASILDIAGGILILLGLFLTLPPVLFLIFAGVFLVKGIFSFL